MKRGLLLLLAFLAGAVPMSALATVTTVLRLYRFRYRDRLRGWITARHALEYPVLHRHYESFETLGPPELRVVPDDWQSLCASHLAR